MKNIKIISLVSLVLVQLFLLTSCSANKEDSKITTEAKDNNITQAIITEKPEDNITKEPEDNTAAESNQLPRYVTEVKTSKGLDVTAISFDDLAPKGYTLSECWNALGIDDKDRVYVGFTSTRSDGLLDFVVFCYDNATKERKFIGTFMQASQKAGNLLPGEEIPKGHTKMIFINGKMYMASQSFHDFKAEIDDLEKYRGSHLYKYDIQKDELVDISANLPDGVVTKNQGIVAISYMADKNTLVCLTHPMSDIVLYNLDTNKVERKVPGIPWKLGNPLSREIIVTNDDKIYTYRGTEDPAQRSEKYNMWEYDVNQDVMKETDNQFTNGFWDGQAQAKDGSKIYISTCNGGLYVLDTKSGNVEDLGLFQTDLEAKTATKKPEYFYSITLSQDETKIYGIPSASNGSLYMYDIQTKKFSIVSEIGAALPGTSQKHFDTGWYTGNNIMDSKGTLYYAYFWGSVNGVRLLAINPGE